MAGSETTLRESVDSVLDTLPPVWDRIRTTLRAAGTSRFGITLEQYHVLRHIREGFGTVGDLAENKQVSRSAISQAVDVLVGKGLVTRRRDASDRRCVHLALTPHAIQVLKNNRRETATWMQSRMARLDRGELAVVRHAMGLLLETFTPEAAPRKETLKSHERIARE